MGLAENTGRKKVAKNRHLGTIAQLCRAISSQLRHVSTIGKTLLSSNTSTCSHNMVNFGPLAAEIDPVVWGIPANFNGFRVLAALLHGTPVLGVSQTLRRWTEGAIYIRQGGHHVGHWPTLLVCIFKCTENGTVTYHFSETVHSQHNVHDYFSCVSLYAHPLHTLFITFFKNKTEMARVPFFYSWWCW